jgi:hypothetical protein
MTQYTLFAGCSYTAGIGFAQEKDEPVLWVNQLHQHFFSETTRLNVSTCGRSNAGIFQDTVTALVNHPVKYAVVEWTSMPRYEMELGFELYGTRQVFIPSSPCHDHNLNHIQYTSKYLNSIRDRFTTLAHDCYEISNVIQYTNTIARLAKQQGTKVFFVNGICPWDTDFFDKKINALPDQYTPYTQTLLNTINRADAEIFELYNKLHNGFEDRGGVNNTQWLNLYSSMRRNRIDVNNDGVHPGPNANNLYFSLFSKTLESIL